MKQSTIGRYAGSRAFGAFLIDIGGRFESSKEDVYFEFPNAIYVIPRRSAAFVQGRLDVSLSSASCFAISRCSFAVVGVAGPLTSACCYVARRGGAIFFLWVFLRFSFLGRSFSVSAGRQLVSGAAVAGGASSRDGICFPIRWLAPEAYPFELFPEHRECCKFHIFFKINYIKNAINLFELISF